MLMFKKLKTAIKSFNSSLLPYELKSEKRKRVLFYFSFYLIVLSTFLTIVSQFPAFTSRGITQLFQVGWAICLIPLLMLDYRRILKYLLFSLTIILPFLLYCLVALLFKISSISYGATILAFLCLFLFIIFGTFSKYKNSITTKTILMAFLVSTILYAGIVFLTKLRGYDLENQIYAFGDKNSAGPIFLSSAVIGFYIFNKRRFWCFILKWGIFIFFTIIIALSKTRSVLITLPVVLVILLIYDIKKPLISFLVLFVIIGALLLLFVVPFLRETIIVNILFNGKTDIDSIFSGRISSIAINMQHFKPILGSGGSYFDCMVLSLLCSYGIVGFISLLPLLILPFFILIKCRHSTSDSNLKSLILCFSIIFLTGALLEGFGYLGTGAKVFMLWFLVGNYSIDVLPFLRKNVLSAKYRTIEEKFLSLSKKSLISVAQVILLGMSLAAISITSISIFAGKTVVDKLPSSNPIAPYVEVKDIQIDPPVSSMCVGQRITFDVKSDPLEAEDKSVYWSTGWVSNPCISVDGYTGEVTGLRADSALLHINRFRIGPNGVYIQFPVKSLNDYVFDKAYISTHEFNKSFEHIENEEIVLDQNCTSKIFYDEYYLPDESKIEFVSTDNNVAFVENGIIRALNPGECEIKAIIHGKTDSNSINKINVKVNSASFVPTTSINLDVEQSWFENQEYVLSPVFNDGASDKNFSLTVSGVKNRIYENRIVFLEKGNATIEIMSDNDNTIKKTYDVIVLENLPSHFECDTKRMIIGETKNAEQLGLYLVFKNGYKKIVTEDDLFFDARDLSGRAWSDRNGLVKNRTTVKAVVSGIIKISCVSKIDNDIKETFKIVSSAYTLDQYTKLTKGVGQLAVTIVLLVSLCFFVFVDAKKKLLFFSLLYATVLCFIAVEGLLYGLTIYSIISMSMIIFVLLTITLFRLIRKDWFPILFLEEPIEIAYKNDIKSNRDTYHQINI